MKFTSIFFCFSLVVGTLNAQSLKVSADSKTAGHSPGEFRIGETTVRLGSSSLNFGNTSISASHLDIEPYGMAAALNSSGLMVLNEGEELINSDYQIKANDSSLEIYVRGDGSVIVRENIANFLLYDTFGKINNTVSNSSESKEGEAISRLASDPSFKTLALYNPKIIRNGVAGSRVKIIRNDGYTTDIFSSSDRAIRRVEVSENGQFLAIATYASGSEDQVTVTDRFGNILNKISFDQDIAGVKISNDGSYLTVYSTGRIAAYSVMNGERLGSASIRGGDVRFADFVPEDQTIIALSADMTGSVLTNVELKAVNLRLRKIASEEYGASLGMTDKLPLQLTRNAANSYTLKGLSRHLNIRASF